MKRAACLLVLLTLSACSQKMTDMPKRGPLDTSPLFSDGAADRPEIPGTVATDDRTDAEPDALPAALPLGLMQHGQDRFNVFCSPCHAYDGHGSGRVVQRGFPNPPDLHSAAIAALTDRQIFDVISNGYGVMFPYGGRVPPPDRWAIVSYIRALQYADHVPVAELTPELQTGLGAGQ